MLNIHILFEGQRSRVVQLQFLGYSSVSVEHLIVIINFQCFQFPLTHIWDIVVGIFAQKLFLIRTDSPKSVQIIQCNILFCSLNKIFSYDFKINAVI